MKNSVLVTTTNSVDSAEIVKYIDLISTNVVVGVNFFSDFGASFTDLFGGYSDTYQNKLQGIYKVAIEKLQQRAATVGANAVVGLKIDFDEISGKGKSMFMVSAIGMAVSLRYDEKNKNSVLNDNRPNIVEAEDLEKELFKIHIKQDLVSKILPDNEQWIYLLNNPCDDIIQLLLAEYLENNCHNDNMVGERQELLKNNLAAFLSISDQTIVTDILYAELSKHFQMAYSFISTLKLFSPKHIQELIASDNLKEAIACLTITKSSYTADDLTEMKHIITQLSNLPDKGKVDTVKGLLSKAKEKYICPNGHNSDTSEEYCSNSDCGKNIKGLTIYHTNSIEAFKEKVDTLASLFSK